MHYTTHRRPQGARRLGGPVVLNAGHGRKEISEAVAHQIAADGLRAAVPTWAIRLRSSWPRASAALVPAGLDHVFFTNSGSNRSIPRSRSRSPITAPSGHGTRRRLIGRERGYHGVGFGGISVGGMVNNRQVLRQRCCRRRSPAAHLQRSRRRPTRKGQPDLGRASRRRSGAPRRAARCQQHRRGHRRAGRLLDRRAGPAAEGYLQKLREICTKHGILLIFDEVITGFGRLGASFADRILRREARSHHLRQGPHQRLHPDGRRDRVARKSTTRSWARPRRTRIELFHGYTYSAHPVACAAGLAALDIYAERRPVRSREGSLAVLGERHSQPEGHQACGRPPQSRADRRASSWSRAPASRARAARTCS